MKKINIIIPFRDHSNLSKKCISSIFQKSTYKNYEIILINNNSKEQKTKKYLSEIEKNPKVRIFNYSKPFNFSAINNFAAKKANGSLLLFLNNDTEVISENWLGEMSKQFENKKVGAVGAKLLYPDKKIQHAGIIFSTKFIAANAFSKFDDNNNSNEDFNKVRKWSAVTAACMMTRKDIFEEVGGFDEINLAIAYNDADYCLRIKKRGFDIVYTPFAKLYHYESASRKIDMQKRFSNKNRYDEFLREQSYMRKKWKKYIANDEFFSEKYLKRSLLGKLLTFVQKYL